MIADELKNVNSKDLVWLNAAGHAFIGLYVDTKQAPLKGAVIVLHDKGGFPDQQPVISLLRSELPKHGWASLALQMPLRELGADVEDYYSLFPEALARVQAGIEFLQKKEFKRIVLVGHGLGALMALHALTEKKLDITALVAISLAVPGSDQQSVQTLAMLKKIQLPLLDVYAEKDLAEVIDNAASKRIAATSNPNYQQLMIYQEDPLFQHQSSLLVKRIYSWLGRVASEIPSAYSSSKQK